MNLTLIIPGIGEEIYGYTFVIIDILLTNNALSKEHAYSWPKYQVAIIKLYSTQTRHKKQNESIMVGS